MRVKLSPTICFVGTVLVFMLIPSAIAFAQESYEFIEEIPGVGPNIGRGSESLTTYFVGVYNFVLVGAGILAVLMLVVGGVQYTTAYGNEGSVGAAKERIRNALVGVLIILAAYIILWTINPELVSLHISLEPISVSYDESGRDILGAEYNPTREAAVREQFADQGISVNDSDVCDIPSGTNCRTQVGGLRANTVVGVEAIKRGCDASSGTCDVRVQGGSEGGRHACCKHRDGYKADLGTNSDLDAYILDNTELVGKTRSGIPIREGTIFDPVVGNVNMRVLDERDGSGPHWDIEFS